MWGFGWLKKKSPESVEQQHNSPSSDGPLLLEDLPPKFEDNVEAKKKKAEAAAAAAAAAKPDILHKAVQSISVEDFKTVHTIPCFRQGILAGFGVGGVIFAVLISTRSSVSRGMNWGMGGFVAGSIVSWEQCRSKMRQSKRNAQAVHESLRKQSKGSNIGDSNDR